MSEPKQPESNQPETDFEATHRDQYAGQGGSYEIVDGRRVLISRTLDRGAVANESEPADPASN